MVQEHWYFDCKLGKLGTVCEKMSGTGKAVDTGDPILPVQMPRGYGGVGVLWRKSIDHLVTSVHDGANRIQCIELQLRNPILIVSVYLTGSAVITHDVTTGTGYCLVGFNWIIDFLN